MKHLLLACSLIFASPVMAGGPVIVEDDYNVEAASPRSGNGLLIVGGVLLVACVFLCGGDDDAPVSPPGPTCNSGC